MNERIQALADQAEDYADGIVDQGGEFHPAYTKKLAELVVRECVMCMHRRGVEGFGILEERMLNEHFGVE